jgi:hypothetical protein
MNTCPRAPSRLILVGVNSRLLISGMEGEAWVSRRLLRGVPTRNCKNQTFQGQNLYK